MSKTGLSAIDVKLSNSGENCGVFHDLRYANDNYGGNQNEMKLEIRNVSGNAIDIQIGRNKQSSLTGKWGYVWESIDDLDGVRIKIRGSIENSEFLQMLQLILETEKMVAIIKP
jgi:hypothetical protein